VRGFHPLFVKSGERHHSASKSPGKRDNDSDKEVRCGVDQQNYSEVRQVCQEFRCQQGKHGAAEFEHGMREPGCLRKEKDCDSAATTAITETRTPPNLRTRFAVQYSCFPKSQSITPKFRASRSCWYRRRNRAAILRFSLAKEASTTATIAQYAAIRATLRAMCQGAPAPAGIPQSRVQ
jgi:hypothetical protein